MEDKINWNEDRWFSKHHAQGLTDGFKNWWLDFYGYPSDFDNLPLEQQEYWVRCAFAMLGWNAANRATSEGDHTE